MMHIQFLTADLADELHPVVARFFVGDSWAPQFVTDGSVPWNPSRRTTLVEVRPLGEFVRFEVRAGGAVLLGLTRRPGADAPRPRRRSGRS